MLQCQVHLCVEKQDSAQLIANWCNMFFSDGIFAWRAEQVNNRVRLIIRTVFPRKLGRRPNGSTSKAHTGREPSALMSRCFRGAA